MKLAVLLVTATLPFAAPALAQPLAEPTLLTAGIVKRVDLAGNALVLDNGRRVRPRVIIVNDFFASILAVRPDDMVFVAGADLGYEEPDLSATLRDTTPPQR